MKIINAATAKMLSDKEKTDGEILDAVFNWIHLCALGHSKETIYPTAGLNFRQCELIVNALVREGYTIKKEFNNIEIKWP